MSGNFIPSHQYATKQLTSAETSVQSHLLIKVNSVVFRRVLSSRRFNLTCSVHAGGFMVETY
jgi:hypothetical protein